MTTPRPQTNTQHQQVATSPERNPAARLADIAARVLGFGLVLGALAFTVWGWLSILL